LEIPTIPPRVLNCAQLLSFGRASNVKAAPTPDKTSGYTTSVCSLTRANTKGSIFLSAASLAAAGAGAPSKATYSITSLVIYYSEKGAGSSMLVTSNGRGRRTVIKSSNATLAVATADVWSPKAAVVPFTSLARNMTLELSPFPSGAAVQLVSVEFNIAAVPEQTKPDAALKGYKPTAQLASTTEIQELKGFSSNDLYNGSYGADVDASAVSTQNLIGTVLGFIVSQSGAARV
jgi:hypothetical protein